MPRVSALVLGLGLLVTVPALAQQPVRTTANIERARVHYFRGWENMRSEAFEKAVEEFGQAIELHPKYAVAHYSLGRAYMALRRYTDAIRALSACSNLYSAEASKTFNSQLDANRQRQDRLMELQDIRSQVSKGPQRLRARPKHFHREPCTVIRLAVARQCLLPRGKVRRGGAAVPGRHQRRCESRRSPQQSRGDPDDEVAVHRRDGRIEGRREGRVSRQPGTERSDQVAHGSVTRSAVVSVIGLRGRYTCAALGRSPTARCRARRWHSRRCATHRAKGSRAIRAARSASPS
jgi:hypothetical protein